MPTIGPAEVVTNVGDCTVTVRHQNIYTAHEMARRIRALDAAPTTNPPPISPISPNIDIDAPPYPDAVSGWQDVYADEEPPPLFNQPPAEGYAEYLQAKANAAACEPENECYADCQALAAAPTPEAAECVYCGEVRCAHVLAREVAAKDAEIAKLRDERDQASIRWGEAKVEIAKLREELSEARKLIVTRWGEANELRAKLEEVERERDEEDFAVDDALSAAGVPERIRDVPRSNAERVGRLAKRADAAEKSADMLRKQLERAREGLDELRKTVADLRKAVTDAEERARYTEGLRARGNDYEKRIARALAYIRDLPDTPHSNELRRILTASPVDVGRDDYEGPRHKEATHED